MTEPAPKQFHAVYQTFDDPPPAAATAPRVAALRAELVRRALDGFVVPHADRYQNEYLPPSEERLAWLTGFTGSAGAAIVMDSRAALFVDGRYTLQAREQADTALFAVEHLIDHPPGAWIEANLTAGQKLGYDPWLHTAEGAERLAKACATAGAVLVATEPNPIDAVWHDRPAPPRGAVVPHDLQFAGETAADKLGRVRAEIAKLKADALVVSDPQAVAWLFNIRGADVTHTPLAMASAIVSAGGARASMSMTASLRKRHTRRSRGLPRPGRPPPTPRTSRRLAPSTAPSASTRRPPPMPYPRRSRLMAAGRRGAPARSPS
jgi:Xaa-Pro aminopeptidase